MRAPPSDTSTDPGVASPTFDVVVPSYGRPNDLFRCLDALESQTHPPKRVYVVLREEDQESHDALRRLSQPDLFCVLHVSERGVVQALNVGIAATTADIVALTDDDAAAPPQWLERLSRHFRDSQVVGVGGRDILPWPARPRRTVGRVNWRGAMVGNHHCGTGGARPVESIKGVNCAYRGDWLRAVGIDTRLKGSGAQSGWELALGARARVDGRTVIYDSEIVVNHYPAPRVGEPQRGFDPQVTSESVYNAMHAVSPMLSPLGRRAMVWHLKWVGRRSVPGLLSLAPCALRFGFREALGRRAAALRGLDWYLREG